MRAVGGIRAVVVGVAWMTVAAVASGGAMVGCSKSIPASRNPQATSTVAPAELTAITKDGLVGKLQQFGGLDKTYATCAADALWPTLSAAEKKGLNQPNPPDALTTTILDRVQDVATHC